MRARAKDYEVGDVVIRTTPLGRIEVGRIGVVSAPSFGDTVVVHWQGDFEQRYGADPEFIKKVELE